MKKRAKSKKAICDDSIELEDEITYDELLTALKKMKKLQKSRE